MSPTVGKKCSQCGKVHLCKPMKLIEKMSPKQRTQLYKAEPEERCFLSGYIASFNFGNNMIWEFYEPLAFLRITIELEEEIGHCFCKQCNKEFESDRKNATFCSTECSDSFFKTYRKTWRDNNPAIETDYVNSGIRAYNNIHQRCTNTNHKSYNSYGGRGIKLELTKKEFVKIYFSSNTCAMCGQVLNDKNRSAGDGRTLDRIDVNSGYKQGNLRLLCRRCNASLSHKKASQKKL